MAFDREQILDALRGAAASNVEPVDENLYRAWAADRPGTPGVGDVLDAFGGFDAALTAAGIRWDAAATPTSPASLRSDAAPPPGLPDSGRS